MPLKTELVLFVCLCGPLLLPQRAQAVTADAIRELADKFEAAQASGDVEALRTLVHPQASYLQPDRAVSRPLWKALESAARAGNSPHPQLMVVHRRTAVHGDTAVVEEVLGAAPGIAAGERVVPRRRSITWANASTGWRIVQLNASRYDRWEASITAYEDADKKATPVPGGIVFVGSSSIRGWKTLSEDFPGLHVMGRGFGGSQMLDSVLYAHRIVTPYQPRAVAVYAGDNDIAAGKSPQQVAADFRSFVKTVHARNQETRIGFIAIKPSLRRWNLWPQMKRANALVAEMAGSDPSIDYLDIATPMLTAAGTPDETLFVKDGLHLTRAGYELWTSVVRPWARNVAK